MSRLKVLKYLRMLAVVAISVCVLWGTGWVARNQTTAEVRERAEVTAQLNASLVRNNLERYRPLPLVLAQDVDIREALSTRSADAIARLDQKLEAMAKGIEASVIYVLDDRGNAIAASNWREPATFVGVDYRFRPYYRDAITGGSSEHFALGTVSHLPGLYVSHRVDKARARAAMDDLPGDNAGTLGVVVVKVEFQRLEADWRRQSAPVFVTDANGVVLLSSRPEWRFRALTPLAEGTKRALRTSLQFGDAEFAQLALTGDADALVAAPVAAAPQERYLHVQTPVLAVEGWQLHVLAPAGRTLTRAAYAAQITTALAMLLVIGAWIVWRQRNRRRLRRDRERVQMLDNLEYQVAERTNELASSNRQLAHEIEERERTQQRAHRLQEELEQASKLSVLGQISAGVAHEVNQPVAAIRSYAENAALLIAREQHEDATSNMRAITALTDRIGRITGELRQFARRRVDDKERRASIAAAVSSAVLVLGTRLRREGIALHIDVPDSMTVGIEPIRLEQILINLLSNAMDALRGVSQPAIWVTAQMQPEPANQACESDRHLTPVPHVPSSALASQRVDIVVRDNGPGIDARRRAELFTPFATGKPDGIGLGLVISRELAREAGGDLAAPPAEVDAAVFVLSLHML